MFSKRSFKELLGQYVLVRLYTDTIPTPYQADTSTADHRKLEKEQFGTVQLPLYVILKPRGDGDFDTIAIYDEGKINDEEAFAKFLKEPLASNGTQVAAK